MTKLNRIMLGEKTYPIKIDLNVLEHIQENYGSINQFEMDILGLKNKLNEKGEKIFAEDGSLVMCRKEPSIRAIKAVLPSMINEGLSIEAEENGIVFAPLSDKDVFRECTISYELLAKMIHEEFARCFKTKK
mgnify:CR=1 FL=1